MMRTLRILGKRGRITIPYEIRKKLGFRPNDVLSFQIVDDRTVSIQRERLCNSARGGQRMKENLRILMVEPRKAPYEASVPHELSAISISRRSKNRRRGRLISWHFSNAAGRN